MNNITGEQHFTHDFLDVYPAFKGELTQGELGVGQQWFRIWQAAQLSMRQAMSVRAMVERRAGRVEVADAIDAAASESSVQSTSLAAY